MADFSYGSWARYQSNGDYDVGSNNDGMITDADNDNQFEGGDTIPTAQDPSGEGDFYTYQGTIDIAGTTYPIFQADGFCFDRYLVFGQNDNEIPVAAINPGDINPDCVFTYCFAAGTLIATPDGECAVETLQIGGLVTTADGRTVPVKWLGRQTVHKLFTPAERFVPVRVRAGA